MLGAAYYYVVEDLPKSAPPGTIVARVHTLLYDNAVSRALRLRDSWSVSRDGSVGEEYAQWLDAFRTRGGGATRGILKDGKQPSHTRLLLIALEEADQCEAVATAFSVGCVIAAPTFQLEAPGTPLDAATSVEPLVLFTGFSRELPGNTHAEECALEKLRLYCGRTPEAQSSTARHYAASQQPIRLLPYTTMEPCSERLSGNLPCVQRIIEFNNAPIFTTSAWLARGARAIPDNLGATPGAAIDSALRPVRISLVIQGVPEPEDFVKCQGQRHLRDAGIQVIQAQPQSGPLSLGLSCPNLVSVSMRTADSGQYWLEDVCLRMAKKGHKTYGEAAESGR